MGVISYYYAHMVFYPHVAQYEIQQLYAMSMIMQQLGINTSPCYGQDQVLTFTPDYF